MAIPGERNRWGSSWARGLLVVSLSGCSLNPATGKVQAFLISEDEEVALGRKSDAEITASMRVYDEAPALVTKVQKVGHAIAEVSERPQLPWTFRVLDDPTVNAFALPGGFVYITRGLLTHLNSEAELAGVLGHEVGHVTARHGAVKLRKTNVARRSVGVFQVIDPGLQHIGGFAAGVAGLALLKYSRDDEYEADDLAVRYVGATGHDPAGVPEVFSVLADVGGSDGRTPEWLSTHPEPELRRERVAKEIGTSGLEEPEPQWMALLEGVVYGRDARDGYIVEGRYVMPRAAFTVDLPAGWTSRADVSGVVSVPEDENALFVLGPSSEATPSKALDRFFADTGLARGDVWEGEIGGRPAISSAFSVSGQGGSLTGLVAFVGHGEQVVAMIAAAPSEAWSSYTEPVATAVASFRPLKNPAVLGVAPTRIRLVELDTPSTIAALNERVPSSISVVDLARINHVRPDETMVAGRLVKVVEGFNPDAVTPPP